MIYQSRFSAFYFHSFLPILTTRNFPELFSSSRFWIAAMCIWAEITCFISNQINTTIKSLLSEPTFHTFFSPKRFSNKCLRLLLRAHRRPAASKNRKSHRLLFTADRVNGMCIPVKAPLKELSQFVLLRFSFFNEEMLGKLVQTYDFTSRSSSGQPPPLLHILHWLQHASTSAVEEIPVGQELPLAGWATVWMLGFTKRLAIDTNAAW